MNKKPNLKKTLKKKLKFFISLSLTIGIIFSSVFVTSNSASAAQTLWTQTDWQAGSGHSIWDPANPNFYESKTNNLDDTAVGNIKLKKKLLHVGMASLLSGDEGEAATWNSGFGYREGKVGFENSIMFSDPDHNPLTVNGDKLSYDKGKEIGTNNFEHVSTNQGTIKLWMKPYFDSDESISSNYYIFDIRGVDDTNRLSIYYDFSSDSYKFFSNNQVIVSSLPQVFTAGSDQYLTLTYDFLNDNYSLYINNDLVQSSTTDYTPPSLNLSSKLNIGSDYQNTNQYQGEISSFIIEEKVWTQTDVTSNYNLGFGTLTKLPSDIKFFLGANSETTLDSATFPQNIKILINATSSSGQDKVYLPDTSGFQIGDLIYITNGVTEEYRSIQSIQPTYLDLTANLTNTYTTSPVSFVRRLTNLVN
ncbi:hypothetical protein COY23_00960, partial [bacterium (Candidatus Torokbacteria) CG_4_10_14_0_2_um_filter_35_8]